MATYEIRRVTGDDLLDTRPADTPLAALSAYAATQPDPTPPSFNPSMIDATYDLGGNLAAVLRGQPGQDVVAVQTGP